MPFADDVRNFPFPSLEHLVSKKGEPITTHPYLPTEEQMEAMEHFVDAMDLMEAGEKNDEGYDATIDISQAKVTRGLCAVNEWLGSTRVSPTTLPYIV